MEEVLVQGRKRNIGGAFTGKSKATTLSESNQVKTLSSLIKDSSAVVSNTASLVTEMGMLGLNISSAFGNTGQYSKLVDAAGATANSYINRKVNRIKSLWDTKVDVSIQSIIGEVAPYALKLEDIGSNLEKKTSKVLGYLLGTGTNKGTLKKLLEDIGQDALDALKSDNSLSKSISDLSAVQAYANAFNVITQVVSIVKSIKNIYETIAPKLSITSDLALTFWSCGTTAVRASNTMVEEVEREVSAIQLLVLYALKKLVFPIKIKLPSLIVGAVDSISVRSAMLSLDGELSWLSTLFDNDFFNDLDYTINMSDSISEALSAVRNAQNSVKTNFELWKGLGEIAQDSTRAGISKGDLMKSFFMQEFTKNYMRKISVSARKTAYIPDYSSLSYFTKESSSESISKDVSSASTPRQSSAWRYQMEDDSQENPVRNLESLRKISKILYDNI